MIRNHFFYVRNPLFTSEFGTWHEYLVDYFILNIYNYYKFQKELAIIKYGNTYNLFGPMFNVPIDFEFETSLAPDGAIKGTINMVNNEDVSKTLGLTFDVKMSKDDGCIVRNKSSTTLAHFLIEQEPHFSQIKRSHSSTSRQKKDNNSNNENSNRLIRTIMVPLQCDTLFRKILKQPYAGRCALITPSKYIQTSKTRNHFLYTLCKKKRSKRIILQSHF